MASIEVVVMCLILDANCYSDYVKNEEDMSPVRQWVKSGGKLVYSNHLKFKRELDSAHKMRILMSGYLESNRAKLIERGKVEIQMRKINDGDLISNDKHIIALALVSKTRLLVSKDQKLHKDFKKMLSGRVYQRKRQKHLLDKTQCK